MRYVVYILDCLVCFFFPSADPSWAARVTVLGIIAAVIVLAIVGPD